MRIERLSDQQVIVRELRMADNFFTRAKGLLGTRELPEGHGLLIRPCNSVHMLGMSYTIDVVFLSKAMEIVRIIPELKPWRLSPVVKGAYQVLELPEGTISRYGLVPGNKLVVT
ncbi:hypothetical protein D3C72_176440 [compost metagenome]